jgi:NAD(P)-dependent dehydrogenase (short-subunit alcohol dehydrogenase family)
MKIDLLARSALLVGSAGPVAAGVAAALAENGARLTTARYTARDRRLVATDPPGAELILSGEASNEATPFGSPWLMVAVHPGAEQPPADTPTPEAAEWEANDLRLLVRSLLPALRRVVIVMSVAGLVPLRANPRFSIEQAGLATMTRLLAMKWGRAGVSVNAVAIGAREAEGGEQPIAGSLLTHAALKRPARMAEIVAAVLFLADPENTYTTGHVVNVDGGFAAGYARNF